MSDITVNRAFRPPDLCSIPEEVKELFASKGMRCTTASHTSAPLRAAWGFHAVHSEDLPPEAVKSLLRNAFEKRADGFLTRGDAMLFAGSEAAVEQIEGYGRERYRSMVGEDADRPELIEQDVVPAHMRGHVQVARINRNFERISKNQAPSAISHISGGALTNDEAERELRQWESMAEAGETPASILAGG